MCRAIGALVTPRSAEESGVPRRWERPPDPSADLGVTGFRPECLLLRLDHGAAGVVAAVSADDVGRRGRTALGAGGELLRLDRVMRATHAGAGVRLLALGDGHGRGEGLGARIEDRESLGPADCAGPLKIPGDLPRWKGEGGRGIHHRGMEGTEREIAGIRAKDGGAAGNLGHESGGGAPRAVTGG
jgi:hypothetical protein